MDSEIPFTPIEDIEKKIKEENKLEKSETFINKMFSSIYSVCTYIIYILAVVGTVFIGWFGWKWYSNKKNISNENNILNVDLS